MIRRGGLGVLDVSGVAGEVTLLQSLDERVAVDERAAGRVDQPGTLLHAEEHVAVEEALGLGREGRLDYDDAQCASMSSRRV